VLPRGRSVAALLPILLAAAALTARAEAPPPPPPAAAPSSDARPDVRPALRNATPAQLFAAVEEAWSSGDAGGLADLVDTTSVRIGLKPGATPTAAMTRSAAAFLFQDQLRLVTTQSFQLLRMEMGTGTSTANARWTGDWGGTQGTRRLKVTLAATYIGGRWYLREVRVKS
jgi:hypothetical protein